MKNTMSSQKGTTEKKHTNNKVIVVDNIFYEQYSNYYVQRWLINKFISVAFMIK